MNPTADNVVRETLKWLGTPYRHQASLCQVGCDCLGLVRGVWRTVCATPLEPLPAYSRHPGLNRNDRRLEQAAKRYLIELRNSGGVARFEPGSVLLFCLFGRKAPSHCAIAMPDMTMIHAQERLGVISTTISPGWRRRVHSAYLFPQTRQS